MSAHIHARPASNTLRRWMAFAAAATLCLNACTTAPGSQSATATSIVPAAVVGHPRPLSLLESPDPALAANKKLAFDMWRGVVNSGHVELADDLLTPNYIQHSPLLPTGRVAFKKIFSVVPRRDPIPALPEPPLVALISEGDLVVMAFVESLQQPGGSGTYTSTHFNLFRVEKGRLAEHWHSLQGPPGPEVLRAAEGGPQPVTGVTGAGQAALLQSPNAKLARNKRLAFDTWREVMASGRPAAAGRYLKQDYIEHNPNGLPVQASIRTPIVAVVAEGDLVALMTMFEHPHPSRAGETYTSTWFDLFRIENGRIVEHWDAAAKPAVAAQK